MNTPLRPILLVDDSERDRELALEALAANHVANPIVPLRDGEEALNYLHGLGAFANGSPLPPAVILLDLKMPKIDGLEVLRQIKSHASLKLIPVVMMTSSREESDLHSSYESGANAYVVKPVNFPDFVEAVKQIGSFWALLNELPSSSIASPLSPHA